MHIFRRPDYQSDASLFLQNLQKQDATLCERQQAGMALHGCAQEEPSAEQTALQQGFVQASIAQQPYVYATQTELDSSEPND